MIDSIFISTLTALCLKGMENIQEIRQLYRLSPCKIVIKPLGYVDAMLQPLVEFHEGEHGGLPRDVLYQWYRNILNNVLTSYKLVIENLISCELNVDMSILAHIFQANSTSEFAQRREAYSSQLITCHIKEQLRMDVAAIETILKSKLNLSLSQFNECESILRIIQTIM